MPSERVLICGAGVAGSIVAYWLAKHDYQVEVIERSRVDQKLGQGIEIEQPALQVVKMMGILDELNERKTGEVGFQLIDEQSACFGTFNIGRLSLTGALELMRGDLTEVLYKAANKSANVTYRYESTIQSLRQTKDKVTVEVHSKRGKSTKTEEYDFVIGADGVQSRTRELLLGSPEEIKCFKHVGAYVAYFSIPKQARDWPYSKVCHYTDRRVLWMRPTREESEVTSVYLIYIGKNVSSLQQANATGDRSKQKLAFAELFSGLGGEATRVIEQMLKADNFYSDELKQVKLPKWSEGRVVLVGDAAWAPTPFTGEGNQLAIVGAWVLAQEMGRSKGGGLAAFEKYHDRFKAYVEDAQNIPLGGYAPYLACPQTTWGIWLLRRIVYTASLLVDYFTVKNSPESSSPGKSDKPERPFDLEIE